VERRFKMKIQKKYGTYIFASIMAIAMSFFMSLLFTAIDTGFENGLMRWSKSFGVGILVAFPTSLLITPVAQKIVVWLTKPSD